VVDWYYIFSILELGVYPPPKAIYNVHKIIKSQDAFDDYALLLWFDGEGVRVGFRY
jgi:hypothetical protein